MPVEALVGAHRLVFFEMIRRLVRIMDRDVNTINTIATVNGFIDSLVCSAGGNGGIAPNETRSTLDLAGLLFLKSRIEIHDIRANTILSRGSYG